MEIGTVIALGAVVVSIIGLLLSQRRENRQDATGAGRMEAKLDGIASGVEDIRVEMRTTRERVNGLSERVSAVESSCKSAHHRIDQMEGRHE